MVKILLGHIGKYKKYLVYCVFLALGEVVCELLIPLLMAKIVDVGIPKSNLLYMAGIGGIMVLLSVLAIGFGVGNAKVSSEASQGFAANLRKSLFDKISQFSFANIDHFSGASLITRTTNDVNQMQGSVMMSMRILTRAPIMLVSALIIAVSINARLSLIILAAILILVCVIPFVMRSAGKRFAEVQKKLDAVNNTLQEDLVAIRVVKAFVREAHEKLKFKKANDDLTAAGIRAGSLMALVMPLMMLVMNGTTLAVIWTGGKFVASGGMSTGALMSFLSYIMQILISVMMFAMVFVMLSRARASAERIAEVLDTTPAVQDGENTKSGSEATVKRGKIEFRDVSFRYTEHSGDVLEHLNFTLEPGQIVGIVGGTGSGKTSLVSLIPRFYDATQGQVLVDGRDVRDYSQTELREAIGMVMQQNNLFSGTIRENLLWGRRDAQDDEIIAAAKDAQAHNFIEGFPEGYSTMLGQGGVNVSGGQKQRLCIARAMLKKPAILILDDSTSAVDTATEAMIRKSFYENFRDSTVIVVAQRISSVKEAGLIIVLDDGTISGMGTHEELLANNDIYREICVSQSEEGIG